MFERGAEFILRIVVSLAQANGRATIQNSVDCYINYCECNKSHKYHIKVNIKSESFFFYICSLFIQVLVLPTCDRVVCAFISGSIDAGFNLGPDMEGRSG